MGPRGKAVAEARGSRSQTFRNVKDPRGPHYRQIPGPCPQRFYLADLRHGPRTVLEKKIPGDPDDGGPLDLDTRLASKGKAKLTDSFVNASGTQSQQRRASQMALQEYRALLMLWFLGNIIVDLIKNGG